MEEANPNKWNTLQTTSEHLQDFTTQTQAWYKPNFNTMKTLHHFLRG